MSTSHCNFSQMPIAGLQLPAVTSTPMRRTWMQAPCLFSTVTGAHLLPAWSHNGALH
jgi:hypothetical protein